MPVRGQGEGEVSGLGRRVQRGSRGAERRQVCPRKQGCAQWEEAGVERGGREEGAEAPQLGVHQASQGPTAQGPIPWGSPYAPSLASLHLFPNLPGVQRHLEETH